MTRWGTRGLVWRCGVALVFFSPGLWRGTAEELAQVHRVISFDEDMLNYRNLAAEGAVSRLQRAVENGTVGLKYDQRHGYLLSVLEELKIPVSSQLLVFSKTSLQRKHISPATPRAIYFNDNVYVAWLPSAPLLEISAVDPKLGAVWYTLEQKEMVNPQFVRNNRCLECHVTSKTMGVPGHLVQSHVTDKEGGIDLLGSGSMVTHETPLSKRWGGWYVSGKAGVQAHLGNLAGGEAFARRGLEPGDLGNLTDLSGLFDAEKYPVSGSDIVAHLVFEHQLHMHNSIVLLNYESNVHLARYGHINHLKSIAEEFLKYLLFVNEAPLTDAIEGTSGFADHFEELGPLDSRGRSLRQLDLKTRLFKYPCSYLIYSEAFESLPEPTKKHLYHRLWDILNGEDSDPHFQKIPADTRRAILDILVETKPGLPLYWTL